MRVLIVVLLLAGFAVGNAHADDAALTLSIGAETRRFTAEQLLRRPDAVELTIPADVSYGRQRMKYRAVPLLPLLGAGPAFDTLEDARIEAIHLIRDTPVAAVRVMHVVDYYAKTAAVES